MAGQARRTGDNVAPWRRLSGQLPAAKADSTPRASRAVPHPSTDRALCRLTSEVRRDPVHSTRYGRQRHSVYAGQPPRQRRFAASGAPLACLLVVFLAPEAVMPAGRFQRRRGVARLAAQSDWPLAGDSLLRPRHSLKQRHACKVKAARAPLRSARSVLLDKCKK